MARTKKTEPIEKALTQDQPERFKLGEIGYSGLNVFNGIPNTELKRELSWPNCINTYKQMSYHSAINSPLTLFRNLIGKATYKFLPPENPTEAEKKQTAIMNSMLSDMQEPFGDVVKSILSMQTYGFSVHEKVFYRRLKSNGSKYDDGLVGIKKIALRNQETIEKFIFSDDGNDVLGVKQNLTNVIDPYGRFSSRIENTVVIPRKKFMLFRNGNHQGNPFGVSSLRDVYLAWRYLTALEEIESLSCAKDLNSIPMLTLPAHYLSADASPTEKAIYEQFKNMMRNIQMNNQSAIILPSTVDPETRQKMFEFSLVSSDGKRNNSIPEIKSYYQNLIFIALFADVLQTGNSGGGSFALAEAKSTLTGAAVETLLDSIVEVFNHDLVRQIYELNEWDVTRACTLDYDNLQEDSLEEVGKFYQRLGATGFLPKNLSVINHALNVAGIDPLPEDTTQEELEALLPDKTTKSGQGMETPFEGTRTSMSGSNSSDLNSNNAA